MTLKVRDAGGILRTITDVKIRDAGGVLRTITSIKVRDAGGILRTVFAPGGGGGGNPAYISPASNDTAGTGAFASAYFTASASSGSPSAYAWGVLDGPGTVISGGATATAQLRISANPGEYASATFYCDVTIGSAVYRATCSMTRDRYVSGGGGVSGPIP